MSARLLSSLRLYTTTCCAIVRCLKSTPVGRRACSCARVIIGRPVLNEEAQMAAFLEREQRRDIYCRLRAVVRAKEKERGEAAAQAQETVVITEEAARAKQEQVQAAAVALALLALITIQPFHRCHSVCAGWLSVLVLLFLWKGGCACGKGVSRPGSPVQRRAWLGPARPRHGTFKGKVVAPIDTGPRCMGSSHRI